MINIAESLAFLQRQGERLASRPSHTNFYLSPAWRAVRYQALKLHGGACQCCGKRATPGHPLHVDHIKPRSKYPELALRLDNLQVLCDDCNMGKSNKDQTDWRPVAVTEAASTEHTS